MRRITLFLAAVATAGLGLLAAPGASAAALPIQPGMRITVGTAGCTANFVYDGVGVSAGRTFIGTAAHCASAVGDDVKDANGAVFGDVAFIGNEDTTADDFAFIEVRTEDLGRVSTVVKGHSAPKGYTTAEEPVLGDTTTLSGYGTGFEVTGATREGRFGVVTYADSELYSVVGPIIYGDSGGPVVHDPSGKALGIVSRLCIGVCTEEGPTVEGILAKASDAGFPVTLR
ncbi:MAG TPA: trypsin-like serine protease [Acidimicrobiales bacterium]|nr:trypsin-like serine protease [Acidimicrobiales bacterium]